MVSEMAHITYLIEQRSDGHLKIEQTKELVNHPDLPKYYLSPNFYFPADLINVIAEAPKK